MFCSACTGCVLTCFLSFLSFTKDWSLSLLLFLSFSSFPPSLHSHRQKLSHNLCFDYCHHTGLYNSHLVTMSWIHVFCVYHWNGRRGNTWKQWINSGQLQGSSFIMISAVRVLDISANGCCSQESERRWCSLDTHLCNRVSVEKNISQVWHSAC